MQAMAAIKSVQWNQSGSDRRMTDSASKIIPKSNTEWDNRRVPSTGSSGFRLATVATSPALLATSIIQVNTSSIERESSNRRTGPTSGPHHGTSTRH